MSVALVGVVEDRPALVLASESAYVTETPTGLVFQPETPIEVWSTLISRLLAQHKRIEWAIADAINFGDRQYGEMYAQWVEETGLAKKTLANIAWVGRKVESSRRREDVDFSYHAEVASLPAPEQDRLLEEAVDQGLSRYALRQAVKVAKGETAPVPATFQDAFSETVDEPPLSSAPPTNQAEAWLLIAELAGFIQDQVMTKLVTVDGEATRHDRHCAASAEHFVCARKCALARRLIERAELLG